MKLLISIILSLLLASCAQQVSSIKEDKDTLESQSDTGYLLIGVDLSYRLQHIDISGKKSIRLTKKDLKRGKSYFLIDMPAGNYAFKDLGLSKRFGLDLVKGYWDFRVDPNIISYVGHLNVSSIAFNTRAELENRSSQALTFLEEEFPNILNSRKVRYRGPGEDPFFEKLENKKKGAL